VYVPAHFRLDDLAELHETIRRIAFGTLVTTCRDDDGRERLVASHVPMQIAAGGTFGTLRGHIARANAQWRTTLAGAPALAIFVGPDAYVTPSWYETKRETGRVVPTWNYVAVHAHGVPLFFDDPERLHALVSELTDTHESARATPWHVDDAPASYVRDQLKGIVGFELPIDAIEGKRKLNQNRPLADRLNVIEGLRTEPYRDGDATLADAMDETLPSDTSPGERGSA
jgi:transcriptional regulator